LNEIKNKQQNIKILDFKKNEGKAILVPRPATRRAPPVFVWKGNRWRKQPSLTKAQQQQMSEFIKEGKRRLEEKRNKPLI
ncbi:MAG: hypothetical protein ACEQSB_07375, partial [Undibacterium sp.]